MVDPLERMAPEESDPKQTLEILSSSSRINPQDLIRRIFIYTHAPEGDIKDLTIFDDEILNVSIVDKDVTNKEDFLRSQEKLLQEALDQISFS